MFGRIKTQSKYSALSFFCVLQVRDRESSLSSPLAQDPPTWLQQSHSDRANPGYFVTWIKDLTIQANSKH